MKNPANNLKIFILEFSNQYKQKINGILPKFCFTTIQVCAQKGFWDWNKNFRNQNWFKIEWIQQLDNNSQAWVLVQLFLFPITNFKVIPVVSAGSFFHDGSSSDLCFISQQNDAKVSWGQSLPMYECSCWNGRPKYACFWMFLQEREAGVCLDHEVSQVWGGEWLNPKQKIVFYLRSLPKTK